MRSTCTQCPLTSPPPRPPPRYLPFIKIPLSLFLFLLLPFYPSSPTIPPHLPSSFHSFLNFVFIRSFSGPPNFPLLVLVTLFLVLLLLPPLPKSSSPHPHSLPPSPSTFLPSSILLLPLSSTPSPSSSKKNGGKYHDILRNTPRNCKAKN